MATLQEIIAKRQAMWPNATNVEARQALMGSISPTPTPVTDVNSDANRLARLQASGGSPTAIANLQTPATPTPVAPVPTPVTPMVTAPVDTTTGLSKPLAHTPATPTPVPTAEVTPVTPKVDATPGITQDTYQQAKAESEKIKAENEAVMAQNKQKADLATQDRQKIAEEARIASIPTDQKGIVSSIISGVNIPVQKTQAYNNAVVISDQFKKFNGMTDVQLLDNLKQGQIGTELDSLLSQNTNYAKAKSELAKAQKTASINRATQIASNVISGKETPVVDDLANIEAKYNAPIGSNEQAYLSYVTQNPDVVSAGTQVKQLSNQISTLTTSYNDALKSIKAQYGDMPASALLTLMGSRTNDTKELLDSYINAKELAKGDFDLAMKMAEGHYSATSKDIAEQQQIASEQRQVQAQKDMFQYKSDFEKQQAQEALNDPATAIASVMDEYKKLGIPFTSTVQSRLAEFNASGKSLPEFLTEMSKNIQESPGYKAYQQKQAGNEWTKLSETQLYNPKTGETKAISNPAADWKLDTTTGKYYDANASTNPQFQSIDRQSAISKYGSTPAVRNFNPGNIMDTGFGGQKVAGERFTVFSSPQEGFNALVSKIQNIQNGGSKVYSPDMTLLQYISKYAPSSDNNNPQAYANGIAKNLGITANTKIRDIDATKLAMEHARHEDGNSYRMLQDLWVSGGAQGTGADSTQYTDQNINDLAYLVELQEKNPTQAAKDMKELGYNARDLANYKAGNVPMTEKQKNSSIEVMNAIKDLADPSKYEWNDAVGFLAGTPSLSGGDAANAEMAINNLVAKLTLPNLGVLKWPMSDKDIAFIKEASSKLSRDQSDASFERNLIDAYNLSARRAGMPEITDLSWIPSGRIIPGQQPIQPQWNTNTGWWQISPEAQSIENEWLNR
jgi:hypothetical protein